MKREAPPFSLIVFVVLIFIAFLIQIDDWKKEKKEYCQKLDKIELK